MTPADLVSSDGACAAVAPDATASAAPNQATDGSDPGAAPALLQGGIGLEMTECDVVRRAGSPDKIDIGTAGRGERSLVLTYINGPRPGIYRFVGGRLTSIEGSPAPPAPPPKGKKKPAAKNPPHA